MSLAKKRVIFFMLLVVGVFTFIVWGNKKHPEPILKDIKQPDWLESVSSDSINSEVELDKLWQTGKRCCSEPEVVNNNRVFYKSCFEAINNHPDDENLVVKCLWLMPTSDSNNRLELYKLLLSHYSNHKNSLYNCTNCNTGDTISRVTKIVAESTASIGTIENIESAIKLLEEVLENRGNDTSAWVQLELHKDLGKLYLRYGVTEEHKQKVNAVYEKFSSIKDNNTISRRLEEFKEIVDKINEKI